MKQKNKVLVGLIGLAFTSAVYAQKTDNKITPISTGEIIKQRDELIKKNATNPSSMVIGIFPGTVGSVNNSIYLSRFLPFANNLSVSTGQLVSFVPELNVKKFKEQAKKEKYQLLYVNAEIAVDAYHTNYTPLVQRKERIVSVLLVKEESPVKEVKDLEGKKIGAVPQAMVSTLAKVQLKKDGLNTDFVSAGSTGQDELIIGIKNDLLDAIVLRKETAEDLIKKNPGKYRIALTLADAPGFILMARKDVPQTTRDSIANSLLALNPDNQADFTVLNGLSSKISPFERSSGKEIEVFETKITEAPQQTNKSEVK